MIDRDDKIEGDFAVEEDLVFRGLITGGAVVRHGIVLDLRGMVCGDLEIEAGGRALIYGMVSGTIINHGGVAEIFGMAQGVRDVTAQAKTIIHADALVRGRS